MIDRDDIFEERLKMCKEYLIHVVVPATPTCKPNPEDLLGPRNLTRSTKTTDQDQNYLLKVPWCLHVRHDRGWRLPASILTFQHGRRDCSKLTERVVPPALRASQVK